MKPLSVSYMKRMVNDMTGHIKDRGNGKFQLEVSAGRDGSGSRAKRYKTIQVKGKTPKAQKAFLEKQLALFVAEIDSGDYRSPTRYTFTSYVEEWKKNAMRNLAPMTFHRYEQMLRLHIIPEIGSFKLEDITALTLDRAYNNLRGIHQRKYTRKDGSEKIKEYTLSEQTIKHIHRLIGVILQSAFRKDIIKENPITRADAPKVKRTEPPHYEEDEISKLIEALEGENIEFKTIVHIALSGGLRQGEICGLEWKDIDYTKGSITVRQASQYISGKGIITKEPKTEASMRVVALPDPVMVMISQLEKEKLSQRLLLGTKWRGGNIAGKTGNVGGNKPDRLFTRADGSPIYPTSVSRHWKMFVEANGLPHLTFHGLRHTSGSYLISCGQDVSSVAKRLGHSNSYITLTLYTHAFRKRDEVAAEHMDKLYNKDSGIKIKAN